MSRSTLTGTKPDGTQADAGFDKNGNLKTNGIASGALTDRSGTGTGAAVAAVAQNADRRYLLIQNPSTSGASFWFSLVATAVQASPSVECLAGQTYIWEGSFIPTGALSIFATTGKPFTVLEG